MNTSVPGFGDSCLRGPALGGQRAAPGMPLGGVHRAEPAGGARHAGRTGCRASVVAGAGEFRFTLRYPWRGCMRWPLGARFGLSTNGTIVSPVSLAYAAMLVGFPAGGETFSNISRGDSGSPVSACSPYCLPGTGTMPPPGSTLFSFGSDQAFRRITGGCSVHAGTQPIRANRAITMQLPHTPRPLTPAARPIQFRRHQEDPPGQPIAYAGILSKLAGGSFRNSHRASSGDTFRAGTPARSHSGCGLAKGAAA
jgi:hypothetical protein